MLAFLTPISFRSWPSRPEALRPSIRASAATSASSPEPGAFGAATPGRVAGATGAAAGGAARSAGVAVTSGRVVAPVETLGIAPFVSLFPRGQVSLLRLLATVMTRPRELGDFWRLARQSRSAAESLGTALGELLTLTFPELEE